jgi:hypothetical protein
MKICIYVKRKHNSTYDWFDIYKIKNSYTLIYYHINKIISNYINNIR